MEVEKERVGRRLHVSSLLLRFVTQHDGQSGRQREDRRVHVDAMGHDGLRCYSCMRALGCGGGVVNLSCECSISTVRRLRCRRADR